MPDEDETAALPQLHGGIPGNSFGPVDHNVEPLVRDGRVGARMHSPYSVTETGENVLAVVG